MVGTPRQLLAREREYSTLCIDNVHGERAAASPARSRKKIKLRSVWQTSRQPIVRDGTDWPNGWNVARMKARLWPSPWRSRVHQIDEDERFGFAFPWQTAEGLAKGSGCRLAERNGGFVTHWGLGGTEKLVGTV